MAQHDYTIANQGFPAFRSDLNDALAAVVSNNSGATEPATMFAHQIWVDTAADPSILKIRNADNDAWITVGALDQTGDTFILRPAAGSASVPAYSTTSDTNTGVYFPGADRVGITTGGTQRVEVDSSGNVGLGATPATTFSGHSYFQIGEQSALAANKTLSATGQTYLSHNLYYDASGTLQVFNTTDANEGCLYQQFDGIHGWSSSPATTGTPTVTTHMTLDASGNLLVGTTSASLDNTVGARFTLSGRSLNIVTDTGAQPSLKFNQVGFGGQTVSFTVTNVQKGYIETTTTAVIYSTSSDYRLKENVAPMKGALAKVLELNPVTYTWKVDGSDGQGFIAHELQEVAPYAVSGEKDGEEMQGVDYGKITPLLTAALQEAIAEIQSLKARVAELEAK